MLFNWFKRAAVDVFTPCTACVGNDRVGFTNSLEMSEEEENSSQMMHFSYTSTVLLH